MHTDGIKVRGFVTIKVVDAKTKQVLNKYEYENLVVNGGLDNLAKLLGGDTTNGKKIDTGAVGTSGTAAALTDTALTGAFTRALNGTTDYAAVTYPALGQVRFAYTILSTEANGTAINEVGLINTAGALNARKVLTTTVNKTSAIVLEIDWVIKLF